MEGCLAFSPDSGVDDLNCKLACREGKIATQAEKFCFSSSCRMKFSLLLPFKNHFRVLRKKALYRNSKYKLPY